MPPVKPTFEQKIGMIARNVLRNTGWDNKSDLKTINAGDGRCVIKLNRPISITVDQRIMKGRFKPSDIIREKLIVEGKKLSCDLVDLVLELKGENEKLSVQPGEEVRSLPATQDAAK